MNKGSHSKISHFEFIFKVLSLFAEPKGMTVAHNQRLYWIQLLMLHKERNIVRNSATGSYCSFQISLFVTSNMGTAIQLEHCFLELTYICLFYLHPLFIPPVPPGYQHPIQVSSQVWFTVCEQVTLSQLNCTSHKLLLMSSLKKTMITTLPHHD